MSDGRIITHPILPIVKRKDIEFYFDGKKLIGKEGDVISSALIAAGHHIFGHHPKDGAALGIFCANGQCAQCMVIVDGIPRKACMTALEAGMDITSCDGLPGLPETKTKIGHEREVTMRSIETMKRDVLIIGGGPAGLSAAKELGANNIDILLIDDKSSVGGKLLLQTHKFFGSIDDCYAGTRGIKIAELLRDEVSSLKSVEVWVNTTAIGMFADNKVGLLKDGKYILIEPKKILIATGAREKMLSFPGNTLPGVYGAGAFQTLVNRDLVRSTTRLFIVGGGNVGLIAGYHALQAGIEVVGLVEALPKCGGYKVHEDKLRRLGVPIYTSHTVLSANADTNTNTDTNTDKNATVNSITIGKIDDNFKPIKGKGKGKGAERTFKVDTILIAVGLSPVDELFLQAKAFGFDVYAAGDADEIAEASSAMFNGKIAARKILNGLGLDSVKGAIPEDWIKKAEILKSPPGKVVKRKAVIKAISDSKIYPIFHCTQEIACNPCTSVCPQEAIFIKNNPLTGLPAFDPELDCKGCMRCVAVCPGLAVTLVDKRKDREFPMVTLPFEVFEVGDKYIEKGKKIIVTDSSGNELDTVSVEKVRRLKDYPGTQLVRVRLHKDIAERAAGIRSQAPEVAEPSELYYSDALPDSAIICRCERVTAGEIRYWISKGQYDMNQLKAITRAGMGACGGKTCGDLIMRLFKEEGISIDKVTNNVERPLFIEAPFGIFAGIDQNIKNDRRSPETNE